MLLKNKPKEQRSSLDGFEGERLIEALMLIKNREHMELFLKDLFTDKELIMFARRLESVYWLFLGTPYSQIQSMTNLSPNIIASMNKKLTNKASGLWLVMKLFPKRWTPYEKTKFVNRESI